MAVNIGKVETFPNAKADKEQAVKVLEESAEVFSAWEIWHNSISTYPEKLFVCESHKSWLLDECADVITAVSNMIAALGVDDFEPYMDACKQRNHERGRYGS